MLREDNGAPLKFRKSFPLLCKAAVPVSMKERKGRYSSSVFQRSGTHRNVTFLISFSYHPNQLFQIHIMNAQRDQFPYSRSPDE